MQTVEIEGIKYEVQPDPTPYKCGGIRMEIQCLDGSSVSGPVASTQAEALALSVKSFKRQILGVHAQPLQPIQLGFF